MNTVGAACGSGAYFSNGGLRDVLQGCATFASAILPLVEAMLARKEQKGVEETDPMVILKELTIVWK